MMYELYIPSILLVQLQRIKPFSIFLCKPWLMCQLKSINYDYLFIKVVNMAMLPRKSNMETLWITWYIFRLIDSLSYLITFLSRITSNKIPLIQHIILYAVVLLRELLYGFFLFANFQLPSYLPHSLDSFNKNVTPSIQVEMHLLK